MSETGGTTGNLGADAVGPVIRGGELAEAVAAAIEEDNPGQPLAVLDRGEYVRIHTARNCRLTRATLEKHLGRSFPLSQLEVEMPSWAGRLRTGMNEYVWYYER